MKHHITLALVLIFSIAIFAKAAPPKVAITSPDNGEVDVSPDLKEIRIEFDQPMNSGGRSIIGGGPNFPTVGQQMKWLDEKTFIIPITLEPDHHYQLSINSDTFKGFASKSGQPAEWYPIYFKTRSAGAAPAAPDVTSGQNKTALAALKQAIDRDYSYRDRKGIDWGREFDARREKFHSARSANEFARAAAHLLRLAEDAHISVQAGDVHIFTRANSVPPNFNFKTLRAAVPQWKEHAGGIISGRFDDGIGYILYSQCTTDQADGVDAALDELKDTKALILDARFNGGGDEPAAQRVAGRFVAKSAIYSKNRLREAGQWKGPFDRTVAPREGAPRYAKLVAVLIGPKVGSSAESFILMMKHGAGAKLIGDLTKGSSGRPMPHQLGNGVTVYLPSWEDQLPDGTLFEGRGVSPDITVKTTLRDLNRSDPVLEAAQKFLRKSPAAPAPVP